ncbi:MAG: 16S rRNA (cytidine(1402)-2'-O)-methyltransferase [Armatimonadota bacterium]|nr:16S rRNA (cytidine(1402)-2'-O)-methyltransferase [bacterium]MDW8320439.1 16S rRNA (cytidine(1402)-2'-O)-methyltransferase [Armatimonadota bacterium]
MVDAFGVLYVVATPIGNLEDITLRALRVLREVDLIAAEDTRITRKLLSHYDIHTPLTSLHEYSPPARLDQLAQQLRAGKSIALVTDAGTPTLSDPGGAFIRRAREEGIRVVCVPGASAITAAVSIAGLADGRFVFDGFPPRRANERRAYLQSLKSERRAVVWFEAPHRLCSLLKEVLEVLGERDLFIARELTKQFEEARLARVSEWLAHFEQTPPRGEFTVVLLPEPEEPASRTEDPLQLLQQLVAQGMVEKEALKEAARRSGVPRRELYDRWVRWKKEQPCR